MSQENNDSKSWETTEHQIVFGVALLYVGLEICEEILREGQGMVIRGVRPAVALMPFVALPMTWHVVRKELRHFDRLCSENSAIPIDPRASDRLRGIVRNLIGVITSTLLILAVAFSTILS